MDNSEEFLFPTNTESSLMFTTHDYETEIPNTDTPHSINDNDSTQDPAMVINTMVDHLGLDITDNINEIDNDYILTTFPTITNTADTPHSINVNNSTQDPVTVINTVVNHLGLNITDDINKIDNDYILTTFPTITNTADTPHSINNNDSTQDPVMVINTMVDHLGFNITDDINKIDNDYILKTFPTITNNSLYHSEDLDTIDNELLTNVTNIFNDTEYNSKNENIPYLLNNSSEIPLITDITEAPQSIINNSLYHSEDLDTIDKSFINFTNIFNDTEYNSRNENVTSLLDNSSEISLITSITEAPENAENVSINGSINNIFNSTVNNDNFSLLTNPLNSTITNMVSNIEEFNNTNNESLVFTSKKLLTNNITSEIFQNINDIEKSSYDNIVSVTHWTDNEAAMEDLLHVSYHVVFPMLICLALIFNCLALYIFRRPKLAALSENGYLQFLSGVNILCALNTIPATILKNHCPFTSFSSAFYYTYFGWTIVFLMRNLSICSLVWMSYDRFLYIWSMSLLQKVMQPAVVRKRLISTSIVIILAFLPLICLGKVENCNDVSPPCNESEEEKWLSFAGYRRDMDDTWYGVLFIFLVQGTIHIILILLTISLFTGLKQKKFKRRKRQMDQTITLIINNTSYLIMDIIYVITAIFFYKYMNNQEHCYNTFNREKLMAIVNCLLMFWSSFSTLIFLLQSKIYRNQVMSTLFPCYTWDTDEKVRKSVRHSIQLQQMRMPEVTRQSIQLQQMRMPVQLKQMKIPEVTQL